MSDMLYRMTDAFLAACGHAPDDVERARNGMMPTYKATAEAMRAAIAVLREPTGEMCSAGEEAGSVQGKEFMADVWRAMINEALR